MARPLKHPPHPNRYRTDPEYRARMLAYARQHGRKARGTEPAVNWRALLAKMASMVKHAPAGRMVTPIGVEGAEPVEAGCYTTKEVGEILGRCHRSVEAWRCEGRFPQPTHWWKSHGRPRQAVYLAENVRDIAKSYSDHLRTRSDHYREDHTEVRDAMFAACGQVAPWTVPADQAATV